MANTTSVRVFDVPHVQGMKPVERKDRLTVPGDGDVAKAKVREEMKLRGFKVRALNWAPDASGNGHELVAYVINGG